MAGIRVNVIFLLLFGFVTALEWKAKEYVIDLDLPPEDRWINLLKSRPTARAEIKSVLKLVLDRVPEMFRKLLLDVLVGYEKFLPKEYVGEMNGIANYLNVSIGDIVVPNILYDFTAFCTSIVAQDSQGRIWHGRNFDYDLTGYLRNFTVVVHFQKQKKTVYTATTFVGVIGIATGQKPNLFTVSLDERDKGDLFENLLTALFDRKAKHAVFLMRDILATAQSFDEAVKIIQSTDTIAPAYYIVGGVKKGEGAVITREHIEAIDTWMLEPQMARWFLVETNYDHWLPPPKQDDRRTPAIEHMTNIGQQHINATSLYEVLSTPPVLRRITVYTTIMSAAKPGIYSTTIQHYTGP